jgi:lysyl-tRNA synthetase class 2
MAAFVGAAGLVSLFSAALVPLHDTIRVIGSVVPLSVRTGAISLTALSGLGLLAIAGGLARRQHLAWAVGLTLLVASGVGHLVKNLDVVQAALAFAMAAILWIDRREFDARADRSSLRRAVVVLPAFLALVWTFGALAIWFHREEFAPVPSLMGAVAAAIRGTFGFPLGIVAPNDPGWIEAVLPLLGVAALLIAFVSILRPVVEGRSRSAEAAELAGRIVARYGTDSLSYFALRSDKSYFFAGEGVVAYTYLWNLGLVSGDPVCPPEQRADLLQAFAHYARRRGWGVAILAGSVEIEDTCAALGLRSFYLGDEAILDPAAFSLEGRQIRKVRQSCHRLERAGFRLEFVDDPDIDPDLQRTLAEVSDAWRGRARDRGFTMALDRLPGPRDARAVTVLGRDVEGRVQGYLHLVPCVGDRPGFSLDQMRRRPDTPNGLVEWMIARTTEELGRRGMRRFSLNFAVRGRVFDERLRLTVLQRAEARLLGWLNPFFQLERLRSFNEKFDPAWVPRVIYYEAATSLPRVILAYLEAEAFTSLPLIGRHGRLRRSR